MVSRDNWYILPAIYIIIDLANLLLPSDFGACLINLNNGRIVENYQSFVQPTEFSITYGCMKTLGISNKTVDGYPPLKSVVSAFQKWVNDIRYDYDLNIPHRGRSCDENAYFCSWSNMDLGSFLRKECYNKDFSYANYMKWWLNAQEIYYVSSFYSKVYIAANLRI